MTNYPKVLINKIQYNLIPLGFCACGCGGQTDIAKQTYNKRGFIKGVSKKFIYRHKPIGGWKLSEATKNRMSQAMMGNTISKSRKLSGEHKRKIGEGNKKAHPATLYDFTCECCGQTFSDRQKHRKYCSPECSKNHKQFDHICTECGKQFKSKAHNAKWCPSCLTSICQICGKEFKLIAAGETRKYCSTKCFHESEKGWIPPNKKPFYEIVCSICGEKFAVPQI